jgi:hypothetical protein
MTGDAADMLARLKSVLPVRWFGDETPILDAVLGGLAAAWAGLYLLLSQVQAQTRIASASGIFLDMASGDYLNGRLPRRAGEADAAFRARLLGNLIAPGATRAALVAALTNVTQRVPRVFEPLNASDTGGYNINLGYNNAGGYGSLNLPYQFFVTAYRANNTPVSHAGGYTLGPGGYGVAPMFYVDAAALAGSIGDAEIYAAAASVSPTASIAWMNISN